MLDRCTWSSSRLRAAMPIVHITFRRLYHTSLIKLHFADHSMYRYCFLLFILHVYVQCYCLRFCAFMICYNIIKLISILDIIARNFHFYVAFCSPHVLSPRYKTYRKIHSVHGLSLFSSNIVIHLSSSLDVCIGVRECIRALCFIIPASDND